MKHRQVLKGKRPGHECRAFKSRWKPRYRLDDVSLVTDLLPLNYGFIVGRFLSVSETILVGE
jgi:hypothetical protein